MDDLSRRVLRNAAALAPLFDIGERVSGLYEIRGCLGAGAMGQVFDAHDVGLNRRVALKAADPALDPALLKREAQGIAAVRHTGVPLVYALGEYRGVSYMVVEYVCGTTLEAHLEARYLDAELLGVDEALHLLTQLAEALAAVHEAGIAHLDVKPANVMLSLNGRVVLTDFGTVAPEALVVHGRHITGTASYMAPEVIAHRTQPGTVFLADLYAFGVLAFELFAGHRPFESESDDEVLAMHRTHTAPTLRSVRDDTPPLVDRLVGELLEKDPLDRPSSMHEVLARLRSPSIRSMVATSSTPPSDSIVPVPPWRTRR